jgi:hypothetical protein
VPTIVSPIYFEKVVSKIAVTDLDLQFEGAHAPQGDVTALSSNVSPMDLDLAEGYQSECFRLSPQQNLIVIFHHEFRNKKIYGYVGGRDQVQIRPLPMMSAPLIDLTTECPKCGTVVCGGQLLCFSCHAIFLFAGAARLYSPILFGVVNMMPPRSRRPIINCDNMIAHLIAYEGRGVHVRSASDAARRLLKQAVLHQAEWNYGRQEQVDNIARKQWGRWWRKKLDGVSSLEYSIELAHRQPIDALKSISLALARAARHYLSWYERNDRLVTYEKIFTIIPSGQVRSPFTCL